MTPQRPRNRATRGHIGVDTFNLTACNVTGKVMMNHRWLGMGAILGFLAVLAGTFAAHGLDQRLSPRMLNVFEVAVRYHMYHALAMILAALVDARSSSRWAARAGAFFLIGIGFFSGSLYLLAITQARWLGMVAPIGGTSFLAGWICLAVAAGKSRTLAASRD